MKEKHLICRHAQHNSGISEPRPTRAGACATQLLFIYFFNIHTYSVILIHDQCLYTAFEHSFRQSYITEIKPQARISPQFGLFISENPSVSVELCPPDPLFYYSQFLGPAITKHSVMPLQPVRPLFIGFLIFKFYFCLPSTNFLNEDLNEDLNCT